MKNNEEQNEEQLSMLTKDLLEHGSVWFCGMVLNYFGDSIEVIQADGTIKEYSGERFALYFLNDMRDWLNTESEVA